MYTIGEISKKLGMTPRAIRLYEEKGLISSSYRGENSYRYYYDSIIPTLEKIQKLKSLGFSLEEIAKVLNLESDGFYAGLREKLIDLDERISLLKNKKTKINNLLSVSLKVEEGQDIKPEERRIFMDAIKEEVIGSLKEKLGKISSEHLDFIKRDESIYNSKEKRDFLYALKDCINFAKKKNLILGPGRGGSAASIILFGLGVGKVDPTKSELVPERLLKDDIDVHMDVDFENGQEFVDYCFNRTKDLTFGKINAFKMPLLNIIDRVHKKVGHEVAYDKISENDDMTLGPIRKGEVEKIFLLEMSPDALVMKYENIFEEYQSLDKLKEYLTSQRICSFRDVQNIIAVWRPNAIEKLERMKRYKLAKTTDLTHDFLSPTIQEYLVPNFGQVIYHEDLIRIIHEYTNWSMDKCAQFRKELFYKTPNTSWLDDFKKLAPRKVYDLVLEECQWTFCKAHIASFSDLVKKTAILKYLHRDIYLNEIESWEKKFGFKWDDIGIKIKGVSLLQH